MRGLRAAHRRETVRRGRRGTLAWPMTLRALEGFVIGVTADRRWTEQAELFQRRGAVVMHGPTIKTEYLASEAQKLDANARC